jgi:hypothetical protein
MDGTTPPNTPMSINSIEFELRPISSAHSRIDSGVFGRRNVQKTGRFSSVWTMQRIAFQKLMSTILIDDKF